VKKTLSVAAIKEGTVIDHITAGQALSIIELLKLNEHHLAITIGLNLPSQTMGTKDLIKIENRFLTEKESHDIAVFAPKATISIIRSYKVEKKIEAHLPEIIQGILICPNPKCITHAEPVHSAFFVEEFKAKIHLRCKYCEKFFERDDFKDKL
jgi:aspartate carbamoyltransferase regulatory subunit